MDVTIELTIVIPVRIDCIERKENLDVVLSFLLNTTLANIVVLEADSKQRYVCAEPKDRLKYVFIEDYNPIFHRTRYLNKLLKMAETSIVGIWDTDVVMDSNQIVGAVKAVKDGATLCYPYDGRFFFLDMEKSRLVKRNVSSFLVDQNEEKTYSHLGPPSVGGAFVVNKQKYLKSGGENENFYGWGYEDIERQKRLEILGEPIIRIEGPLFHLYHPRGINSDYDNSTKDQQCLKELIIVCKMNKKQLTAYVNNSCLIYNPLQDYENRVQHNSTISLPLISVIMPVYNCDEYVETAIISILYQTYKNFEFIIINDGSTDSTADIVKKIKDDRIIFIDHYVNMGNYHRRNEGIAIAKGVYICIMDGDDEASPFRLEAQVSFLKKNKHVLAAGSQFEVIGKGVFTKLKEYEMIKIALIQNNMLLHPSLLIRKRVLEEMGGYNEKYYYASDYDLVCRLAMKGEIVNMPDVLMKYRRHENQISSSKKIKQKEYADLIRLSYLKLLGFSLTASDEFLFNQVMNQENVLGQEDLLQPLFEKIINQNRNIRFFDHDILTVFLQSIENNRVYI